MCEEKWLLRHVRIPLPLDHLHNLLHHCGGGGGGGGNRICCYGGGGHDVGPLVREPHAAAATATAGRPLQRRGGRPVGSARGHEHDGGQRRERRERRRRRRGRRRLERGIGGGGGGRPRLFAQRYRKKFPFKAQTCLVSLSFLNRTLAGVAPFHPQLLLSSRA